MTIDSLNGSTLVDITNLVVSKLAAHCEQNQLVLVVDTSTTLAELELDSLALMEVAFDLEEMLDIALDPTALLSLHSVSDLIAAIQRVRKNAA